MVIDSICYVIIQCLLSTPDNFLFEHVFSNKSCDKFLNIFVSKTASLLKSSFLTLSHPVKF